MPWSAPYLEGFEFWVFNPKSLPPPPRQDAKTARLRAGVTAAGGTWHDMASLSEQELARRVRADQVGPGAGPGCWVQGSGPGGCAWPSTQGVGRPGRRPRVQGLGLRRLWTDQVEAEGDGQDAHLSVPGGGRGVAQAGCVQLARSLLLPLLGACYCRCRLPATAAVSCLLLPLSGT